MEEDSYELLSSMSPKVKHCQKHFRKGTTILALRKSLQRSVIYDKSIHTVNNDKLITTELSSTTTTESSSSGSSNSHKKLLNIIPIIIHDSDSDSGDSVSSTSKSPDIAEKQNEQLQARKCDPLPQEKFENIKQWIDNVNQSKVQDSTACSVYSELSTIYGENKNFITERTGRAVNSTVIGSASIHFDELFKHKTHHIPKKREGDIQHVTDEQYYTAESFDKKYVINISSKEDVIDESYVNQSTNSSKISQTNKTERDRGRKNTTSSSDVSSFRNRSVRRNNDSDRNSSNSIKIRNNDSLKKLHRKVRKDSVENDSDHSFSINESLNTRLQKNKSRTNSTTESSDILNEPPTENKYLNNDIAKNNNENGSESVCDELASMLDDLYGIKWREKEAHVLPKTEPRKKMHMPNSVRNVKTERKPKLSVLYKNPYLETEKLKSNDLLKSLQISRVNNYMESPVLRRLNTFCDSDTDSKDSESKVNPRVKLNFNNSDCEDDNPNVVKNNSQNNEETKSKYFRNNVASNGKTERKTKKDSGSDKENLDESLFLGQSLEERIRKKMNGIKSSDGGKRKIKNIKTDKKKPLTSRADTDPNKVYERIEKVEEKKTNDRKLSSDCNSSSSDDVWENEISKIVHENKQVNGKYSFLASLSVNVPIYQCDMSARIFRNNFKLYKDQLLPKLFKLFNEKVFENALPQSTLLEWNDRMRGTAGFCYCKKVTRRTGAVERTARIVLSTKVIDAAYRLRDTLIHEMCHAAAWIVNCVSDGHGPYWKSWAYKAMQTFPELPPIKRCHDYVVNTKYTYKCTGCGYSIGRHSKSLDIERKRCGHCYGKFEVLLNKVSKKGETKSVPATPKKEVTGFALFVKENYGVYKQGSLKHGDVMRLLGQKFQELKLKPS